MPDHHEGQRVSRRSLVAGIGSIGLGTLIAACSSGGGESSAVTTSAGTSTTIAPRTTEDLTSLFADANTCTLTASTTQGPYYFDADKIRGDIREDRQGKRLRLAIKLQDSEKCAPLGNAVVEIWHCDAAGLYSGAESLSQGGQGGQGGGAADLTPTDDKRYLRGAQVTGADGIVQFTTVWPGWYRGRTVHVHAMVHVSNQRVLTTQVMFDEALNTKVFAEVPYSAHTGRDTLNDNDNIYQDGMLLKVTEDGDGYLGVIVFSADSDKNGK